MATFRKKILEFFDPRYMRTILALFATASFFTIVSFMIQDYFWDMLGFTAKMILLCLSIAMILILGYKGKGKLF